MKEKEIRKKIVFDGKLFRVWHSEVELEDGSLAEREYSERKGGSVGAVVLDRQLNIYLVREFLSAIGEMQTHIPGGSFNPKEETPEVAVVREVREEVGKRPGKVERLFEYRGGGSSFWPTYIFLCTDLKDDPAPGDWDEKIQVIKVPFREHLIQTLRDKFGRFGDFKAVILTAQKLGLLNIKQ